ncbi:SH3 domain-containing protein [Siminovitchia sp. FSL H7-0308]|uniref:N-acetylglucosaminidase n=1 Tax=Siminovitchia sp. FSL H7-0308 TaxID=2921432 RepID=UPI0030EDB14A
MSIHASPLKLGKWLLSVAMFLWLLMFGISSAKAEQEQAELYLLNEDLVLYENAQPVATLKKNSLFFMTKKDGQTDRYLVQYGDRLLEVTSGQVSIAHEAVSQIASKGNSKTVTFEKQMPVYSADAPGVEVARMVAGQSYPIHNETEDVYQFVIGNRVVQAAKDSVSDEANETEKENEPSGNENDPASEEDVPEEEISEKAPVKTPGPEDEAGNDDEGTPGDSNKSPSSDAPDSVKEDPIKQPDTKQETIQPPTKNLPIAKATVTPKFQKYFKAVGNSVPVYVNRGGKTTHVGNLVNGQEYVIVGQIEGFLRIHFGGQVAYVRTSADIVPSNGSSIKNVNRGAASKGRAIQTKRNPVIIYDNTSGSLVAFGELKQNESYTTVMQTSQNWFQVIFGGRLGYIYKPHVIVPMNSNDRYFQPYYSNTPVYMNRNGKSVKVGDLKSNQEYQSFGQISGFVRIQYGNGYAYVRTGHVSASEGKSIKNHSKAPFSNTGWTIKAKRNIPVYDNTSGRLVEFGSIDLDQEYITVRDSSNYWLEVNLAGRIGYIYKPHAHIYFKGADKYFQPLGSDVDIIVNDRGRNVVVGKLSKEQAFRILGRTKGFLRFQYGNGFAYVRSQLVYPSKGNSIKNANPGKRNSKVQFRTARTVPIYDNTSGSMVEFASLEPNQSYHIIRQTSENWLEVSIGNRIGYVYLPWVSLGPRFKETAYGLTLQEMLNIQMKHNPQTDKKYNAFVSAKYIDQYNRVIADSLHVRGGPSPSYWVLGQLPKGQQVKILRTVRSNDRNNPIWYEIEYDWMWKNASPSDVAYYLNPNNFSRDSDAYFQFLVLSESAGLNAAEVNNKILAGKGILSGKASAFIEAARIHKINDVYLISHSLLETGNGTSTLANGVMYNGKKVYNMYGVGASDRCPVTCGAKFAYDSGWFTPEAAIIGGAKFISNEYIHNKTFKQDTLYKMRWNPVQSWHQYATDIGWAVKQVFRMKQLYNLLDTYSLIYDIPVYK